MASTVLPNGIIIPEKFSRDWYADLYHNWQELDNLLGGGTPKDGTLTIQKNGTTVGTFSANQATNETVNITVPDVNNGTLTIQQNGTTVDTFTANSSTDKTVNISVPTKTSDLTNDSGFITEDNTKIPLAGSSQISGSLIPSTDGTVNLGGTSYQWNNAYIKSLTINGVACGDILTHNASEFVGITGAQTIAGNKTFSDNLTVNRPSPRLQMKSTTYSSETSSAMTIGDITFLNNSGGFSTWIINQLRDDLTTRLCVRVYPQAGGVYKGFAFDDTCTLYPENSNNALGTSANKWKSFNGINPGALSLPSTYVNVDTTNWILDGSNINIFTPASDGWLGIQAIDTVYDQMHYVFVGRIGGGSAYYQQNLISPISALWDSKYRGCIFIPVIKNINYHIRCICSSITATFYPCQGNV